MDLHALHGYDDCDKPESMLHFLIPRDTNECTMFQAVAASAEGREK